MDRDGLDARRRLRRRRQQRRIGGDHGQRGVSIKDAPSDHITRFEVDITSVNLVRDDGTQVAVLPGKTRVSQLLTVSAGPGGTYTSTRITFDMSGASIGVDGNPTPATVVDAARAPLTGLVTRDIDMKGNPVKCQPGTRAPFTSLGSGGFVLDLSTTGRRQVDLGQPTPQALQAADRPQTVQGGGPETPKLSIVQGGTVTEHQSMAAFSADCAARLAAGAKARGVNAMGQWDATGKKLAARQVTVMLE